MASSFLSAVLWALAAAAWLRCPLGEAGPPEPDPGPCVPPRDPSAPTGLRGYRRFHANDSLIGRPVPCTWEEKVCFRHNLLFSSENGRCEPLGGGVLIGCSLRANRTAFEHGSGRLSGACAAYTDPCPGHRMAYDGRCYRKEVVRDVICGCGANPVMHFLFGFECRSAQPPTPINVSQPSEDGRCLIPDLRFPDTERKEYSFKIPHSDITSFMTCETLQVECFSQTKVWVSGHTGCYSLLERGPCPEGHLVAMDVQEATAGRAVAVCVHERGGCPPGFRRMSFDGRCHEDRVLKIAAPGYTRRNHFGEIFLTTFGVHLIFKPYIVMNGNETTCYVLFSTVKSPIFHRLSPPCGTNDEGKCDLYEVETSPPSPLGFTDL